VSLRYFNIFGPRQDANSEYSAVLARFITRMLSGKRPVIYGDGEQSRDFTYIDNAVAANLLACTRPAAEVAGRVFNIAGGKRVTINEVFRLVKKLTGFAGEPQHEAERAGDIKHSLADIGRAQKHLGYEPAVDLEEGLRRTVEWYRKGSG
jgi:UDP-glucose 4-epimerase